MLISDDVYHVCPITKTVGFIFRVSAGVLKQPNGDADGRGIMVALATVVHWRDQEE